MDIPAAGKGCFIDTQAPMERNEFDMVAVGPRADGRPGTD
jgi:hypothetical protein